MRGGPPGVFPPHTPICPRHPQLSTPHREILLSEMQATAETWHRKKISARRCERSGGTRALAVHGGNRLIETLGLQSAFLLPRGAFAQGASSSLLLPRSLRHLES